MLEFDIYRLLVLIVFSLLCLFYVVRKSQFKQKFLLFVSYIFITLYSGVGAALKEANIEYLYYYIVYVAVLSITIRTSKAGIDFSKDSIILESFLKKNARKMIIAFFVVKLFSFITPEFKLFNLINPPSPSLEDFDFAKEGDNYGGPLASLLYLASVLIMPFFYLGLYYYRRKIKHVIFLILLNVYMAYCNSGYVGRGTILQALIICFFIIYFNVSKKGQKRLIVICSVILPFLLFGFYYYSVVRLGKSFESIPISEAIDILFGQEIQYPLHYDNYIKISGNYISEYVTWLLLQPLPGFLKFGLGDFFLNREFSIALLGVDASDSTFFILLPGLVGEALFVFGPLFFVLHAIILGIVIKFVLRTFTSNGVFEYIYYLCIVQFSFMLGRAGTVSVYPTMFKSFLILVLTCMYIKNKYRVKL